MKQFISISLFLLVLGTVAAQCGSALSPADTIEKSDEVAQADEPRAAENDTGETRVTAESPTENMQAPASNADQPTPESKAQTESETVLESSNPSADCTDPFAGTSLRFSPDTWTAESLARFVSADVVDPDSGLKTNFCQHSVDYKDVLSGGPPPDGIPPIDNPTFDSIATGDEWLADVQPVIALAVGEEAKAYPLAILTRHEIANDEIAGIPVAVTFCPLCNAAVVFKREVNGEVLRFGVSGNRNRKTLGTYR